MDNTTVKFEALDAEADSYFGKLHFKNNDYPICPHCGKTNDIDGSDWGDVYKEGIHRETCIHCDLEFTIVTRIEHKFSTDRRE